MPICGNCAYYVYSDCSRCPKCGRPIGKSSEPSDRARGAPASIPRPVQKPTDSPDRAAEKRLFAYASEVAAQLKAAGRQPLPRYETYMVRKGLSGHDVPAVRDIGPAWKVFEQTESSEVAHRYSKSISLAIFLGLDGHLTASRICDKSGGAYDPRTVSYQHVADRGVWGAADWRYGMWESPDVGQPGGLWEQRQWHREEQLHPYCRGLVVALGGLLARSPDQWERLRKQAEDHKQRTLDAAPPSTAHQVAKAAGKGGAWILMLIGTGLAILAGLFFLVGVGLLVFQDWGMGLVTIFGATAGGVGAWACFKVGERPGI